MKIWQILTKRLKKYENLANFDKETEKSMKIGSWTNVLERSTKISYFFCLEPKIPGSSVNYDIDLNSAKKNV